jgi:flavin-dependent dehydrogenase
MRRPSHIALSPPRPHKTAIFDLAVIGGGPAGTCAAITAARAGAHVLLLERGRLPRQRVCGEFVSAESLSLLAGLLASSAPALLSGTLRIPQARLFFDGHSVPVLIDPPAASIARSDLDFTLWQAAQQAGVSTRIETTLESVTGSSPFTLRTQAEEFHARAVINASGRWSNLRPAGSDRVPHHKEKWLGLKTHFFERSSHPSVDLYFFEGGYCGVQPVELAGSQESRINVCAMVRSDMARSFPEVFALHAGLSARASKWQRLMEPLSTSPLIFREPEPVHNGVLVVGDAAVFVDPFIGDGISLALRSGALAAECLLPFFKSEISLAEAALQYEREYRNGLLPVFRNSSLLRRLLRLPRPLRKSVGHLLEMTPALSRLLVRITR